MEFTTILQNVGLPIALLIAIGMAVWRATVWFGKEIIKPVADRHIKFLDELSTGIASQSQALQTMAIQQGKNLEGIEGITERMEEIVRKQDEMVRLLATMGMSHMSQRQREEANLDLSRHAGITPKDNPTTKLDPGSSS